MPELPEVETIAQALAKRITGDVVQAIWLGEKPEPLKSPAGEIVAALEHSRIARIRRMGKHIVFDLEQDSAGRTLLSATSSRRKPARPGAKSQPPSAAAGKGARRTQARAQQSGPAPANLWIVHLGMTGRLQICQPQEAVVKHTHAIVRLASGRELRFVDPRRFGRLSVAKSSNFDAGGLEPLEIDLDSFRGLFRRRKTPIKSALLNQKLLRGVGNIYADEALFRAGIRPRRRAASLSQDQLHKLLLSVREVLREAIALGGSSISDYVDANGEEGFFQLQHRVYGREDEPCLVCKTPIKRVVLAGRSSHYCPVCQQ